MHRYLAVAGMTLGIAYIIWLIPRIGAFGGIICLLVGLPLSGVALYRARKHADGEGTGLALAGFAVNIVGMVVAIPLMWLVTMVYGTTVTGGLLIDIALAFVLWGITLGTALWVSRAD